MHRAGVALMLILGVVALPLLIVPSAVARDPVTQPLTFHSSSTLICSTCHTMHYSEGGKVPTGADASGPFPFLLLKKNSTDLCLNCHAGLSGPDVMNGTWPGGNFFATATAGGHGHNPGGAPGNVSMKIVLDATLGLNPPGATGPLLEFTCTSCHGPHGWSLNPGVPGGGYVGPSAYWNFAYRLLRKHLPTPGDATGNVLQDVSGTIVSNFYDEQYAQGESDTNHNVYRSPTTISDATKGFGAWCAGCHPAFHQTSSTFSFRHPTAQALSAGDITRYTAANPAEPSYVMGHYDYLYPVETSQGILATTGSAWAIAAAGTERVFCLSCHRAHGSAYLNAGRWNFIAPSGTGAGCNKCHGVGQ